MKHSVLFLLISWGTAAANERIDCRAIYVDDRPYCSVSFYEILSDTKKFSEEDIRLVGYLRYESNAAYLSPDLSSIEGPILADNVISLAVGDDLEEIYRERNGARVEVFGTFRYHPAAEAVIRGRIDPVTLISPR